MVTIDTHDNLSSNVKIIYLIPGSPRSLQRARWGAGRVWDPQKQEKVLHGIDLLRQHDERKMYGGPLLLEVMFYMQIPLKGNIARLDKTYHIYKPDLDNLIKFVKDIATKILYNDDCLISDIVAKKRYDKNPRTEFTITELK